MTDRSRILVVDDDPDMCQILDMQLSRGGYEVDCVGSAGAALAKLTSEPFDLALIDLMMPGMSGIDLLRMIRKTGNDIPVIILTGRESLDTAVTAVGLHVSGYLRKATTSGAELIDAIKRALDDPLLD